MTKTIRKQIEAKTIELNDLIIDLRKSNKYTIVEKFDIIDNIDILSNNDFY